MISKSPEQQMQYDARRKFQTDEIARLEYARDEGLQEGRQEGRNEGRQEGRKEGLQTGVLLGRIAVLQEFLGLSEPSLSELQQIDEGQLSQLAEELQSQLRTHGKSSS